MLEERRNSQITRPDGLPIWILSVQRSRRIPRSHVGPAVPSRPRPHHSPGGDRDLARRAKSTDSAKLVTCRADLAAGRAAPCHAKYLRQAGFPVQPVPTLNRCSASACSFGLSRSICSGAFTFRAVGVGEAIAVSGRCRCRRGHPRRAGEPGRDRIFAPSRGRFEPLR